jgi:hypothetical protein
MSEVVVVSSRKRSLESDEKFEKLLVWMVYTTGDMSHYECDYDSSLDLSKVGSMTCSEADAHIGLFGDDCLGKQWSKVNDATAFYRLQQEYKCFVLVLHDGNE